jgi:hypothetical protein
VDIVTKPTFSLILLSLYEFFKVVVTNLKFLFYPTNNASGYKRLNSINKPAVKLIHTVNNTGAVERYVLKSSII